MEEGEFKKRINQELKLAAELQYSPLRPRNQSEVAGMLETGIRPNVHAILDEAKKECPTYEVAKIVYFHRVQKIEITSGLDEAGVQQILASLWGEWFVKWFGTEEVKKSE